jgi:hypothetical protein
MYLLKVFCFTKFSEWSNKGDGGAFSMQYENTQNKIDRKMESHVVHGIKVYFQEKWCV